MNTNAAPPPVALIVDDEANLRMVLRTQLQFAGYVCHVCTGGQDALATLKRVGPVDVILTDLRMPGMDGAGLYRELLARDPGLAARMVFLSGDIAQLGALEGEISEDRVMAKPVELMDFERFLLAHK